MESTTRPLAVFDVDDTLNLLSSEVSRLMFDAGKGLPVSEWRTYDWTELFKEPVDTLLERLMSGRLLEAAQPNPAFAWLPRQLLDAGYEVEAWTARNWHPRGELITKRFFDAIGVPDVTVRLSAVGQPKGELLVSGRAPALFLDDSASHVADVAARSPDTLSLLVSRPWNRESPLQRVTHGNEVIALLQQRGHPVPAQSSYAPG